MKKWIASLATLISICAYAADKPNASKIVDSLTTTGAQTAAQPSCGTRSFRLREPPAPDPDMLISLSRGLSMGQFISRPIH